MSQQLPVWWFASGVAAGPGPNDPGDPIPQSLRFRGAQRLFLDRSNGNTDTWTISCWMKPSLKRTATNVHYRYADCIQSNLRFQVEESGTTRMGHQFVRNSSPNGLTTECFRDPSAWYHLCVTQNGGAVPTLFINGEPVQTGQAGAWGWNNKFTIGANNNGTDFFAGYLAQYYYIDGQALQPTAFGRQNANDVWVPRDINFNGNFGANGFHLTFDPTQDPDPQVGIGMDSSPNNNHFTATGFNTAPVGVFDQDFFTQTGNTSLTPNWASTQRNFLAGFGPERALNGNTDANDCVAPSGSGWVFFRREFTNVTSLRVWGTLDAIGLNNAVVVQSPAGSGPHDLTANIPPNGTITSLASMRNGQFGFSAIEINGNILVNNPGGDYDVMADSPTQNHATYNPLMPLNFDGQLFDANLQMQANVNQVNQLLPKASQKIEPGMRVYCEYQITATNGTNTQWNIGLSSLDGRVTTDPKLLGRNQDQVGIYDTLRIYVDNVAQNVNIPPENRIGAAVGSHFMMAIDFDNGNIWYGANGEWYNWDGGAWNISTTFESTQPTLSGLDLSRMPFITGQQRFVSGSLQSAINFGQQPFIQTPPAGFVALQTQNLPAPTINNGRDHFTVHLDPGGAILPAAQGIFPHGLYWIKDRTIATNANTGDPNAAHRLVDTVRGVNLRLACDSQDAETAYIAPPNDCVAWCWNAPTEFTNAAGANGASIASTGRANTVAGFSIVTYTGTGAAGTVNHGLSETPDWYVVKRRSPAGSDWRCFHIGLANPADEYIPLNQDSGVVASSDGWDNTLPTNQVFSIKTAAALNTDGDQYVAYCWHSVPGYSAFGSYTGNGDNDGPYVELGFKPSFLLLKQRNSTGWWQIRDSTRNLVNPANTELYANTDNRENGQGTRAIDLLSNGFKLRNNTNAYNAVNNVYIYCAFAENSFQAPVTAR